MKAFYYRLLGEDNPLLRYTELYEAALNEFAQKGFLRMPRSTTSLKKQT